MSRFLCFSDAGRYSLLAKKRDIRALCSARRTGRMNDFAGERLEINEDMRTRTVSYIMLQINSTHSPMKQNAITAKSRMNVTNERQVQCLKSSTFHLGNMFSLPSISIGTTSVASNLDYPFLLNQGRFP